VGLECNKRLAHRQDLGISDETGHGSPGFLLSGFSSDVESIPRPSKLIINARTGFPLHELCQAHMILAFVKIRSVYGHKDSEDPGLMLSACIGKFEGADFCVPELDHRIQLRSGDFMAMGFVALAHCVTHIHREHVAFIHLSKSGVDSLS